MRVSIVAVLAYAAQALAQIGDEDTNFDQIDLPDTGEVVPAGKSYLVKWTPKPAAASGPVIIMLAGGPDAGKLQNVSTIGTGIDNSAGQYLWNVDSSLGSQPAYGIKIILDSDRSHWTWGKSFKIAGSGSSSSSSGSATATTTSTSTSGTVSTTQGPNSTISTTSSSSVVVQTSTAVVPANKTIAPATPKPTSTTAGSGAAAVTAGFAAVVGGIAFAALGL